jgi:hypothetical protein
MSYDGGFEVASTVELTQFERLILQCLLAGDDPVLSALRTQLAASRVSAREFSGTGVFVHFEVLRNMPAVDPPALVIGDLHFQLRDVEMPCDAILFVRSGRLDMLECFTYGDHWPKQPIVVTLNYTGGPAVAPDRVADLAQTRDWGALRHSWFG